MLESILSDLAIWAPLSADIVECLHGASQSRLHRFRGGKPTDETARHMIVLEKITSAYAKFKSFMWERFGDKGALRRMNAYNKRKGNQYTSSSAKQDCQTRFSKSLTFEDLDAKLAMNNLPSAPRKVCGCLFAQSWQIKDKERERGRKRVSQSKEARD